MLSVLWRVDAGREIGEGDELATVQWSDNSRDPILCPPGCNGRVVGVNGDIIYEVLARRSQWLLRF